MEHNKNIMNESSLSLQFLRRKIAKIEHRRSEIRSAPVSTGHAGIDRALGGGLVRGRLHELFAGEADDAASVTGFSVMLARRLGGEVVWLREERAESQGGAVFAPGLVESGIDPARLLLGVLPDPLAVLRAAGDVVRCPAVSVAVIELWRNQNLMNLTASRRLALAAEQSGVTVLLLRIAAEVWPSAAQTRWSVRSAASLPLEANAPGHPALEVELLRQRGGPAGGVWQLEWNREQAIFRDRNEGRPALSGAMVSFAAGRPADADGIISLCRTG
jgi:protein ImuA